MRSFDASAHLQRGDLIEIRRAYFSSPAGSFFSDESVGQFVGIVLELYTANSKDPNMGRVRALCKDEMVFVWCADAKLINSTPNV